jgi:hypothetical protein
LRQQKESSMTAGVNVCTKNGLLFFERKTRIENALLFANFYQVGGVAGQDFAVGERPYGNAAHHGVLCAYRAACRYVGRL